MKSKTLIFGIAALLMLNACTSNSTDGTSIKLIDNGGTFAVENEFVNPVPPADTSLPSKESAKGFIGKKPEPFINEELPVSYTERTFLKGLVNSTYDIYLVPGYIVRKDPKTGLYQRKTLTAVIKNNRMPVTNAIADGLVYSNRINKSANFNASAVIGGLSVGDKQMMELVIQDIASSTVPDSLIDKALIASIVEKQIPAEERKNYFYVKSATLTLINNKIYRETSFEAKVNSVYVTAEGKISTQMISSREIE